MVHVKTVRMNAFILLMGCVLGQRSLSGADMDLDEIVHNVKSGANTNYRRTTLRNRKLCRNLGVIQGRHRRRWKQTVRSGLLFLLFYVYYCEKER